MKRLIIILLLLLTGCSGGLSADKTSDDLKGDVVYSETIKEKKCKKWGYTIIATGTVKVCEEYKYKEIKRYFYTDNEEYPAKVHKGIIEDVSKRRFTESEGNLQFFDKGNGEWIVTQTGGVRLFLNKNNKSLKFKNATTTKEAFDEQTNTLISRFIKKAQADVATTSTTIKDTYERKEAATTNSGTQNQTHIYTRQSDGRTRRPLYSFTLPSLTGTISKVSLSLYTLGLVTPTESDFTIHEVNANTDWVEAQTTWNIAKTGTNWNTAGGDFDATVILAQNTDAWASQTRYSMDIMGGVASNPLTLAFGDTVHLLLKDTNEAGSSGYRYVIPFYSKEATGDDQGKKPWLEMTYTPGGGGAVEVKRANIINFGL